MARLARVLARVARLFGRRRTPVMLQFEATECGAVCLGIVLAHFGRWVPLQELREACGVTRDGCSATDIVRAARRYGLRVTGWRQEPDDLAKLALPAILFWEFSHFVVLDGIGRRRYHINDPAFGHRTVSADALDRAFTGVALLVERTPEFRTGESRRPGLRLLWPWFADARGPLVFAAACGLLLLAPMLATPILVTLLVDHVLAAPQAPPWAAVFVGAAAVSAGLVYLLAWLQHRCLQRLNVRLSIVQADRFVRRLFRLPVQFFTHRLAGDLMARMQVVSRVAAQGSVQLVGIVLEIVISACCLLLMVFYDPLLAALVAALAAVSVVLMRVFSRLRIEESWIMRRHQAMLGGLAVTGLRNVEVLQATAAEDDFYARWSGHQALELHARQRYAELGHVIGALPTLFSILGGAAVIGLGGLRVIDGGMTVGMLMGFYIVAGNFLRPVGRLVQFADMLQVLEADLQRLHDVFDATEDPLLTADAARPAASVAHLGGRLRLAGRLALRDVTFGYRRNGTPLIENFSLALEPGQRVAVVGATGSGKSTLVLLLSGIHAPWSGEVSFDGTPLAEVPRDVLTASVAVVSQRPFLFAGTVRDNLTLWNPTVPREKLIAAARDALMHDTISERPGGYDSLVEEGGRNFSGGQRQRLEIARALVRDPSILVLDEATCALDAISEVRIDDALRRRGCTCLIVAHRLSTIRDCDRIVVLDQGRQVQAGTHEELLADEAGAYHRLVQAH